MNLNDESPTPHATTATQKTKLVWSTPRVVTLDNEVEGKALNNDEGYIQGSSDPTPIGPS